MAFRKADHTLELTSRSGDALLIVPRVFTEFAHLDVGRDELVPGFFGDDGVDVASCKVDISRQFGELLVEE